MATTNTATKVRILSTLTTRDSAGRHFTSRVSGADLSVLETEGLITINRPAHEATGIPYGEDDYSVKITEKGVDLVDANPEYWGIAE